MQKQEHITITPVILTQKLYYRSVLVLSYFICYPHFSASMHKSALQRLNAFYHTRSQAEELYATNQFYRQAVRSYRESKQQGLPFHPYEMTSEYMVTYNKDCAVSLYTDRYEFTGGAHGTTERRSETWNLNNGNQISLGRLFMGAPKYPAVLKSHIKRQIGANSAAYFDDYAALVEKSFRPQNYYLTDDALAIYFQQYDIAPYATGIPTFLIPYSELNIKLPQCRS